MECVWHVIPITEVIPWNGSKIECPSCWQKALAGYRFEYQALALAESISLTNLYACLIFENYPEDILLLYQTIIFHIFTDLSALSQRQEENKLS